MKAVEAGDDAYAGIAELYDLEHESYTDDLDVCLDWGEAVGDPVLERGCGTGRLVTGIAEAGFRVTGTDRSDAMLARAKARVERSGLRDLVELRCGEMSEADRAPGGPFGVIVL